MSLLGDLQNAGQFTAPRGPRCSVCTLLTKLSADEADALRDTLAGTTVTHAALSRILTANGYRIGAGTLRRHRAGECHGLA